MNHITCSRCDAALPHITALLGHWAAAHPPARQHQSTAEQRAKWRAENRRRRLRVLAGRQAVG